MDLYEALRQVQTEIINQNKAQITITRTTRTAADDGGYTETTTTKSSQDVRIYNKNIRVLNVDEGGYHSQRAVKMIAKYDADILPESATNLDTFNYGGKTYKVKDVEDVYMQGCLIFKECYLEEIN